MSRRIVALSPEEPRQDRLVEASEVLRAGGIVALPTETFYGLAADAFRPEALARVNRIKRKAPGSPILLLLAGSEQVGMVARDLPPEFSLLAERFWPGPLTMVVPAAPGLPREVSGGRGTVGVRVPGLALPRRLAEVMGGPITGVSANRYTEPPCRTAEEVVRAIGTGIDLILDGGAATGGAASTVLDLTGPSPRILRDGAVPVAALRPFLANVEVAPI